MPEKSIQAFEIIKNKELEAQQFGFYWENIDQLIDQIKSECHEIKEAHEKKDSTHLQEEIGDLLQAAVSLAIFCKIDPEETLKKSIEKFQKRYQELVELVKKDGHNNLKNKNGDTLMYYWNKAKKKFP